MVTTKSGVSGVHWVITPIVNTLVMIDRSDKDNSYLTLSDGRPAFACAHDLANPAAGPRALDVIYNAFCSGGIFWPNGTLVVQGGYQEVSGADIGYNAVRNLDPCPANGTCDFYEYKGERGGGGRYSLSFEENRSITQFLRICEKHVQI